MKKIIIFSIFIITIVCLSFINNNKNENSNKIFNNDIKLLSSRSWIPVNQATQFTINKGIKINYGSDFKYKLTVISNNDIQGDTLIEGEWFIDNNKKIHVVCYNYEKIVEIIKISETNLSIKIDNGIYMNYVALIETKSNNTIKSTNFHRHPRYKITKK